jgi:hypothetical protein
MTKPGAIRWETVPACQEHERIDRLRGARRVEFDDDLPARRDHRRRHRVLAELLIFRSGELHLGPLGRRFGAACGGEGAEVGVTRSR